MISKNDIVKLLLNNYDIELYSIKKIKDGSADLFIINNIYVLKIFQLNYNFDRVEREQSIIDFLKQYMIVPSFIKNNNRKYYSIYKDRIVILMDYISGYSIEAFNATKNQIIDSANKYGKLISVLTNYKKFVPEYSIDKYTTHNIEETVNNIKDLINRSNNEDINNDLRIRLNIINDIKNIVIDNVTKITCHGDYYVSQCIYENDEIKTILDYGSVKKMPVSIELIRSYIYLDNNGKTGKFDIDNLILYVKEFMKYYKLNNNDLKFMPHMYLIKLLRSDFGYKQYIENSNRKDEFLAIGKKLQNQIIFIYNNLNKISKELERILE